MTPQVEIAWMERGRARDWYWGWGSLCLNAGLLEPTKKQSPRPLAEPLLRDEPIIDHMLLLPLATDSTTWAWVPPIHPAKPAHPGLWFKSVTFNEIHQGASWLDLLHLPRLVLYGGRPLEAAKEWVLKPILSAATPPALLTLLASGAQG